MTNRDIIYYSYLLRNYRPLRLKWRIYCKIRKMITISESPSKIFIYTLRYGTIKEEEG